MTDIPTLIAAVAALITLLVTAWQLRQTADILRATQRSLHLEAYNAAIGQLIEMKHDFIVDAELTDAILESDSHFKKARGCLPPRAFMCVCKSFYNMERICLLRYTNEISDEEWIGLAKAMLPYLGLKAFEDAYKSHVKEDEIHHPEFLRILDDYYKRPRESRSLPDPLEVRKRRGI
jgi:hypothetical protein